jgi:hypothetical protein
MLIESKATVLAVANATALAAAIVHKICGNEVANTLNGVAVNKATLTEMISSQIHANYSTYTSKGVNL